jgi:hypothetical protein
MTSASGSGCKFQGTAYDMPNSDRSKLQMKETVVVDLYTNQKQFPLWVKWTDRLGKNHKVTFSSGSGTVTVWVACDWKNKEQIWTSTGPRDRSSFAFACWWAECTFSYVSAEDDDEPDEDLGPRHCIRVTANGYQASYKLSIMGGK